jgi:hypothetical protein
LKKELIFMRKLTLMALLLVALLATACPERTNIGKIQANPQRYYDKDIAIAGNVTNSFGIPLVGGIYKLDDGTGSVWIVTKRSVPNRGAQVGVKGRIQDGISFSGKNYGLGMFEDERRIR